jgi:type IV secretory pathway VirB10-like protein
MWTRLRAWRRQRKLPEGFELAPEPRTTRLNRRVLWLVGVLLVAVVSAAIATLSDTEARLREARAAKPRPQPAPEPFWKSEPDGVAVAMPTVPELEPEAPETLAEVLPREQRPIEDQEPSLVVPEDEDARGRKARLRRAYESPPIVSGFRRAVGSPSGAPATKTASARPAAAAAPAFDAQQWADAFTREPDPTVAQNNQAEKRGFLDGSGVAEDEEVNPHLPGPPRSPFEVVAGSIVPAVLVTAASSDLPGLLTARVRENVYDSATGAHLLIPQGTVVTGTYDSVVTYGQERLLVAWQRLLFPDGTKLNIGSMPGADAIGRAGFEDQIDRHYVRLFGSSALMSVISAGLQLSQGDRGGQGDEEDLQETLSAALGQNLGETSAQLVRRNLNVQPSLEIRPGYRFNVLVRQDLIFRAPYGGGA